MKKLLWTLLPYAEIVLGVGVLVAQFIERSPGFTGTVEDIVEVGLGVALVTAGILEAVKAHSEV